MMKIKSELKKLTDLHSANVQEMKDAMDTYGFERLENYMRKSAENYEKSKVSLMITEARICVNDNTQESLITYDEFANKIANHCKFIKEVCNYILIHYNTSFYVTKFEFDNMIQLDLSWQLDDPGDAAN